MKNIFPLIVSLTLIASAAYSQKDSTAKKPEEKIKQFYLAVLKTGPKDKEITDSTTKNKIFADHFSNMTRLYEEGILKAAGPFGKNEPAVAAGVFVVDILPWISEPSGSFVPGKPKKKN